MSENIAKDYSSEVVKAWDEASWNFKWNCDSANDKTSVRDLYERDWNVLKLKTDNESIESVIESIDWVWTKVQIYTERFNKLIDEHNHWRIIDKKLFEESVELWERMLHDLIAMNVDDLRNGEMAVWVTNIIDINHLKWVRWKVFSDSMWQALYNVITELDIAMTAWETAILWEPKKVKQLLKIIEKFTWWAMAIVDKSLFSLGNNDEISSKYLGEIQYIFEEFIKDEIKKDLVSLKKEIEWEVEIIKEDIEFNIGWTWLWVVWEGKKLVELKEWQAIVYLWEKETENWIIWPRSNWLTAIRRHMEALAWEGWENLSFIDFLDVIWDEAASKIPSALYVECEGLKMWDIATWKTTVFNPFVSRKLLWWLEWDPIINAASLIHVTWNPWRKIAEWLKWRNDLAVDLDISNVTIPQIIEILLRLWCMTDEEAISWMNMWVPYAFICDEEDVETIISEANKEWYKNAGKIWTIVERKNEKVAWVIKWVWIKNTEVEIEDESV